MDVDTPALRIGVAGACGRMGRSLIALIEAREGVVLTAAFDRPETRGDAVDGITLTTAEDALGSCDVIIDFSEATASATLADAAAARGGPALLIGSTGFSNDQTAAIAAASVEIPIVKSGNFSLGVNLLAGLVAQTARRLAGDDWDIEILEAHHRRKIDAPSGTALMLGEAAARGRERALRDIAVQSRHGVTGPRPEGAIGFSAIRAGGIVGEHSVVFAAEDEILTLFHSARDRRLFGRGALQAAVWVVGRPPALYDMMDVLGFARGGV